MSNNKYLWCPFCLSHKWCGKLKGVNNYKCLKCKHEFKKLNGIYVKGD